VFDVQSNFSDPFVNVIIMKEDRANFVSAPEKVYLNKEACITGVVALRNNLPYVIVRSPQQIKLKSKPTLEDIALYVGDSITVKGQVFSAKYFAESATNPTLLNLGAPFPDQPLTVVIEKENRPFFEPNPELFYLNKEVSVTGKVELFKGKPQITVRSKAQLQMVNDNSVVMTSMSASNAKAVTSNGDQFNKTEVMKTEKAPVVKAAQFPGGEFAWTNFLNDNLKLPEQLAPGERKTVTASFIVNADGSIGNIKILVSAGEKYDNEVVRVLSLMPRWRPKTVGNTAIGVIVTQPITFKWESPL
jgi:DNA/RNA endonuclease YhcR with UshA esterase domain